MVHEHEAANRAAIPRLLPWSSDGKPCWLSPESEGGFLSQLADAVEADLVRDARELLAEAHGLLGEGRELAVHELRFVASRLAESLANVLRVAESRGMRLGVGDPTVDDDLDELGEEGLKAGE